MTLLLDRAHKGDPQAAAELLPLVYTELRRLAGQMMMREGAGHTLQPTALVHEAWLRLVGSGEATFDGRGHFYAAASEAMRRILIDNARRKHARRHGGGQTRVDFEGFEAAAPDMTSGDLLDVHGVLDEFAAVDAHAATLVKLRCFAGMAMPEAAEVLGVPLRTAERTWSYARAWLRRRLAAREREK